MRVAVRRDGGRAQPRASQLSSHVTASDRAESRRFGQDGHANVLRYQVKRLLSRDDVVACFGPIPLRRAASMIHITPHLKEKGMKWNGWHAFRRGLATNLHEMGVPTKVIQRVCRHADEATTKKHYIHATEPGVQSGMRELEASITREKYERR